MGDDGYRSPLTGSGPGLLAGTTVPLKARPDATMPGGVGGDQGEAAAARREWEDLRRRYAAAVPDAAAAALAGIRDLGPQGNAGIVFGPDSTPDAERTVRDVQRLIPRDWLATPDGRRLTAVDGDTGRYEPDARRATVADLDDSGVDTAAHALAQHFAGHLPDLDAAQRAFWFTRTHTGRPGTRTLDHTALGRLLAQQQTQTDTGDNLALSLQAMFTGDWYEDDGSSRVPQPRRLPDHPSPRPMPLLGTVSPAPITGRS